MNFYFAFSTAFKNVNSYNFFCLIQVSLKFTFTENCLGAHSLKLAGEPFYYQEMSLFSVNVHLKHLVKVKFIFGESELQ